MKAWPRHPTVYEINTRVWLREQAPAGQHQIGLGEVPERELDRLAAHGFHAIWLMGVWTTGAAAVRVARQHRGLQAEFLRVLPDLSPDDVIGSPYAISAYAVPEALGGPEGLAGFRERLRGRGIRLLLDFVPNHTARDHPETLARPEAFIRGTEDELALDPASFFRTPSREVLAHGRDPYFPGWTDTAQVDVTSLAGLEFLRRALRDVAEQCDGVRCDMAMLALPDVFARTWGARCAGSAAASLWPSLIRETRASRPGFLFLAESYWGMGDRLLAEGFDYAYDKTLYDRLKAGDASGARAHLAAFPETVRRGAHFVENHDEDRAAVAFGARGPAATAASLLAPGLRLLHEGQEDGRLVRVPVQLARRPAETPHPDTQAFHARLLPLLVRPETAEGDWRLLEVRPAAHGDHTYESLLAYGWAPPGTPALSLLMVANLSAGTARARVLLPPDAVGGETCLLLDHADGARYPRETREMEDLGLYVALRPGQVHLFELLAAGTPG